VGIEVFEGSTGDPTTRAAQVDKRKQRFDLTHVVLVSNLDPLIKSQVADEAIQGLSCKISQNEGIQPQWLAGRL
jgi:hypothetical protein